MRNRLCGRSRRSGASARADQGAQAMPLPTRSACSAAASPGGQIRMSRGVLAPDTSRCMLFPVGVVAAAVEGSRFDRSRAGSGVSDMILVAGASLGKVALAPGLAPVMVGCAVVPPVAFAAVAVAAAAPVLCALTGGATLGNGTAPEVAAGEAPGGGGVGPLVVVAIVEGEVEVV